MTMPLRRQVLDASLLFIVQVGPDALSVREVARRAGVSHQAPYKHFADREAILAELVEEGFHSLAAALDVATPEDDPVARIAGTGQAYVLWALAHPGYLRLLFRPDLVDATAHPKAAAAGQAAWAHLDAVARAVPGDPEVNTALLWSAVHGLSVLLLDGPLPARGSVLSREKLAQDVPARLAEGLVARARGVAG